MLARSGGLAAGLLVLTALLFLLLLPVGRVGLVGVLLVWVLVGLLNHSQISKKVKRLAGNQSAQFHAEPLGTPGV
ncbi:hypothetical protein D3C80_2081180 [compost metagenome]